MRTEGLFSSQKIETDTAGKYWGRRRRLITMASQDAPNLDEGWLDLDSAATVAVTSEAREYPVESVLVSEEMRGWRATTSGT